VPFYMDRHDTDGATAEDLGRAHALDLEVQDRYGVRYLTYWFDYAHQRAYCLVDAPDAESAARVHAEAHGDMPTAITEVDEPAVQGFLGRTSDPEQLPIAESATRTVVFTDMVGSTDLFDRLGDEAAMAVVRAHDSVVRDLAAVHGGRTVKHTGDGFLLSFASPSSAVRFAIDLQRRLAHPADATPGPVIRIGINTGEPLAEGGDLYGAAVLVASRLCDRAAAASILVSEVVRGLTIGKGFTFADARLEHLKGFAEPVGAVEVRWEA
jgi:class 3 adenylate cyclase